MEYDYEILLFQHSSVSRLGEAKVMPLEAKNMSTDTHSVSGQQKQVNL